jgi:2-polyprenyl-3-methyl-5-hydroxy-6-metoxy-1,4-benzoquinol methylase
MPTMLDNAVEFHDELAAEWEQKYQKSSFASRQEVVQQCLEGIALKGATWLDAGCGTGTLARWLAEQGCEVEAVDASAEMLRFAEQNARGSSKQLQIRFRQIRTIEALPFPPDCFKGILCSSVLEYVSDPDACLEELRRVLQPNGILLVSVPNARSIVRTLLKMTHACTATMGRPWPKYLSLSKFEYSVPEFRGVLHAHALRPEKSMCFGVPSSCFSNNPIVGSLLMFRARK